MNPKLVVLSGLMMGVASLSLAETWTEPLSTREGIEVVSLIGRDARLYLTEVSLPHASRASKSHLS